MAITYDRIAALEISLRAERDAVGRAGLAGNGAAGVIKFATADIGASAPP